MTLKVGINGYGRIGRGVHRALLERDYPIELVAVNDPNSPPAESAYLLKNDSVHRRLRDRNVRHDDNSIWVDGTQTRLTALRDPGEIPWADLGAQVVIDSTGLFAARVDAARHLDGGAKRVIISAPSGDADASICMGINHDVYDPAKVRVASNASCTTNCLASMARVLEEAFGLKWGLINTIHAYTSDQALHDVAKMTRSGKPDFRRMRAASLSSIPSSTGAARAIGLVLPALNKLLDGVSVRIPAPDGSLTDLVVELNRDVTREEVNEAFIKAAQDPSYRGVLSVTDEQLVSSDFLGDPSSCTITLEDTMVHQGNKVRVFGWYDNEWGYANRLIDLCLLMGERGL